MPLRENSGRKTLASMVERQKNLLGKMIHSRSREVKPFFQGPFFLRTPKVDSTLTPQKLLKSIFDFS